ncbi:MAG: leucyl/phenylalanyl-tRNA--protein transferase [Streptosporangiales bacterium]|nr:leucyl/phenylalanyl-tRNA--protein transferase [Streptosporangiales bacterium]MBO0889361.1 leucyl/phenylalanyl-tRNA--protein transferase [Acidothermales bacterium]
MPIEPPATAWRLPDPRTQEQALVGVGADLAPGTLLAAYRSGLFPMPLRRRIGWWSPLERGVLPLDGLLVSRSLRRSCRRFEARVDTAFDAVVAGCAERGEPTWITAQIHEAYRRLFDLGWAHSVETWNADGELVGGLYGVAIGGLFAGESMFHRETDASKVALVALVRLLTSGVDDAASRLLDTQWLTPHLASLGCVEITRDEYLTRLGAALSLPLPPVFRDQNGCDS